jgi:hypothetical protein
MLRNIPEECRYHLHRGASLKSRMELHEVIILGDKYRLPLPVGLLTV